MTASPSLDPLLDAVDRADEDPAVLRELLRTDGRRFALEHGEGFRAAVARLPRRERDDPFLAALVGISHRVGPAASRVAPRGYLESAVSAIGGREVPPFDAASVLVAAAGGARIRGTLSAASDLLDRADGVLETTPALGLLDRLELTARIAYERGVILVHLGRFDAGRTALETAAGLAEAHLTPAEAAEVAGELAVLDYAYGDYPAARDRVAALHGLIDAHGLHQHPYTAMGLAAQALVALELEGAPAAEALLPAAHAAALGGDIEPFVHLVGGQIAAADGRFVEALDRVGSAEQVYLTWEDRGVGRDLVLALRAAVLIGLGEGSSAMSVLAEVRPHERHAVCPGRMRARLALLTGDLEHAEEAIAECEELGDTHLPRTYLDVLLARTAIEAERGDWARADQAFDRALLRLTAIGARSPLRFVPAQLATRLLHRAADRPQPEAVRAYLAAIDGAALGADRPAEPLSARERVVLGLLEERLTVAEMASRLFVSPNTVKTHLQRLYRKLGVGSREEALQRARVLGIRTSVTLRSPGPGLPSEPIQVIE